MATLLVKKPDAAKMMRYRKGAEGFILWAEDNVCIPVFHNNSDIPQWTPLSQLPETKHPETGRSYKSMWEEQKKEARKALVMKNGRFVHRLLIFCWPRGEGKSLFACIIQLWKFFCWPRQQIMLGANSKDQVKFVHFDIMRDIILNSPNLLRVIGKKNVQEKEIRIKNKEGNIVSVIRAISSFSGIVSNITGYTFSEIFDMKNPKFFVQLDGSIRNMPNAFGVIDSTVSEKSHILYRLYTTFMKKADPSLFFSYRYSREGHFGDYWNPMMTYQQLESYKNKFPKAEFERYFLNLWSAGAQKLFTPAMVEATHLYGADGFFSYENVLPLIQRKIKMQEEIEDLLKQGMEEPQFQKGEILNIQRRLTPLPYELKDKYGIPTFMPAHMLEQLSTTLQTGWAIGIGLDRADPMKAKGTAARSILTVVAKGLPGSLANAKAYLEEGAILNYVYFLLHLSHIESSSLEDIKLVVKNISAEYDGVETFCSERWGVWDLEEWLGSQGIPIEAVHPTYTLQKTAFSELFTLYKTCRFKTPITGVSGSKSDCILEEEALNFDNDPGQKFYGSPEKDRKYGIQDDAMYSLGWCIYGMRNLSVPEFRVRKGFMSFGEFKNPENLAGSY